MYVRTRARHRAFRAFPRVTKFLALCALTRIFARFSQQRAHSANLRAKVYTGRIAGFKGPTTHSQYYIILEQVLCCYSFFQSTHVVVCKSLYFQLGILYISKPRMCPSLCKSLFGLLTQLPLVSKAMLKMMTTWSLVLDSTLALTFFIA